MVFGFIIAIDNFLATLWLCYISITQSKKAGDAANIAKTTKIPAIFWALIFLSISILIGYKSYIIFLPLFR